MLYCTLVNYRWKILNLLFFIDSEPNNEREHVTVFVVLNVQSFSIINISSQLYKNIGLIKFT